MVNSGWWTLSVFFMLRRRIAYTEHIPSHHVVADGNIAGVAVGGIGTR